MSLYKFAYQSIGMATKWLRILSLGGIDNIRNHLVANSYYEVIKETCPILYTEIKIETISLRESNFPNSIISRTPNNECIRGKFKGGNLIHR